MGVPRLIVMLTHNDKTIENACEVFEKCKNSKADFWGFKEIGLSEEQMKKLFAEMKSCGKTTFLEVVAYTESECLEGAKTAAKCGCDVLMGTRFFDSVNDFCKTKGIRYMPFVGNVYGRPSVLEGTADEMISEAKEYLAKGVYGIDFLGYRLKDGDAAALNKAFVEAIDAPVCIAGSINTFERLDEIKKLAPWGFTVGGAFTENLFGGDYCEEINRVCDYISQK